CGDQTQSQTLLAVSLVTPVAKTGLHCGRACEASPPPSERVTPVAKTGLHCGAARPSRLGRPCRVTPVAKTGLHCGDRLRLDRPPAAGRAPGREDRAPLRPGQRRGRVREADQVTPVAKTGLHCGLVNDADAFVKLTK